MVAAKLYTHVGAVTLIDPRRGDVEDDASSSRQRSLVAIAGTLLAEISLPKLLFAWFASIVLPGVLLGLAPLIPPTARSSSGASSFRRSKPAPPGSTAGVRLSDSE